MGSFASAALAQIYGNVNVSAGTPVSAVNASATIRYQGLSSTTRAKMRAEASTTRAANIEARQENMMQRETASADKEISARIDSLNNLIAKINGIKNVSATDKTTITASVQNEIAVMTSLKTKIDADTGTTTLRDDLKSITGDYRVYALIEPQIAILTAADRINQIISLMTIMQNKLQTRISALQSAGKDTSSLTSIMADITAKMADAQTQGSAAITATASLTPDQGNAAVAASNTAALKTGRADIKAGNTDLQAVRKDMETVLKGIRSLTPKGGISATTTVSATTSVTQ